MKKIFLSLAVMALAVISCKKKDDDKGCPITKDSIAGTYRLTVFTINGVDQISSFDACERDDLITLNTNGTYVYEDAGVECAPSGDDTGNWDLSGNQFSIDYIPQALTLESFDCTNLKGTGSTGGFTVNATLTKQ